MEDFFKSVKAYMYERTSNPLTVSFVVAWLLHNYRVVVILFSDENFRVKFVNIDAFFSEFKLFGFSIDVNGYLANGLLVPLAYSLIYIYVYPYFSLKIYSSHLKFQNSFLETKQRYDRSQLLSVEQSVKIRDKLLQVEREYDSKLERLESERSELTIQVAELIKKINSLSEGSRSLTNEHMDILTKHLNLSRGDGYPAYMLAEQLSLHLDKVRMLIDDLLERSMLINNGSNSDGEAIFALTNKGRKALLEKGLI